MPNQFAGLRMRLQDCLDASAVWLRPTRVAEIIQVHGCVSRMQRSGAAH
jgi:hypothetical protein